MENSISEGDGFFSLEHGELTKQDGGRDWFGFTADGGENYIIEVESRMQILEDGGTPYVEDKLVDPSILEIVNEQGEQVLGEQDGGGFIWMWARGYFTAEEDGTYYIAVGSGGQDRGGFGHYTISVRQDDHADDYRPHPDVKLLTGQSITARINSDVGPDDTDPNAWAWAETGDDAAVPRWGIESADDKDVFRFEITKAGRYVIAMADGPPGVGIWAIWYADGTGNHVSQDAPVDRVFDDFEPGHPLFRGWHTLPEHGQYRRLHGLPGRHRRVTGTGSTGRRQANAGALSTGGSQILGASHPTGYPAVPAGR